MSASAEPRIVERGAGKSWWIVGDTVRCMIESASHGGAFSLFETTTPAGAGPPPHLHRNEDETFFILEGTYEFLVRGKAIVAGPGTTVFAPRRIPHAFRNPGPGPARMLILATPGGLERFFEECAREIRSVPPEMPRFMEICGKHGIEILPPS